MSDDVLSAREALEKAFAETAGQDDVAVNETAADDVQDAAPVADDTQEAPSGPLRDAQGRFAPKEAPEAAETPEAAPAPAPAASEPDISAQFNDAAARAAFAAADPALKAEISRRFGDMQRGIEEHRARWDAIKQFDQQAQASGTTLAAALANYTHVEQTLARNPLEGLDLICRNFGTDLRSVAAHVLGRPAPEGNAQVSQLQQRLDAAERELRGYRTEKTQAATKTVEDFFTAHPRANELSRDIAFWVQQGFSLEQAYSRAEALNPIPAAAQTSAAPAAIARTDAAPPAPKGPVSIKGAPTSGSNPARATEILSSRDAVARAFAATR